MSIQKNAISIGKAKIVGGLWRKNDFIYKGESDEFMYGRYEFQDQGCRCDNKSGGQRPVNPSWEYDRLDDPARFGIGRFEKDREGILVDGKKSVCTSALGCHDTANAFQMDRQTYRSKSEDNALYQIFCRLNILRKWRCPDHTKIEEFRNLYRRKRQRHCGLYCESVDLGFGDPTILDVDSTVQESNMSYPSDATLMRKLSSKCKKLLDFLREKQLVGVESLQINLKWIVKKYQEYVFLAKNTVKAKRQEVFRDFILSCRRN